MYFYYYENEPNDDLVPIVLCILVIFLVLFQCKSCVCEILELVFDGFAYRRAKFMGLLQNNVPFKEVLLEITPEDT